VENRTTRYVEEREGAVVNQRPFKIQESFLNHCRKEKITVVIQLFDQTILEGLIIGFDQESLVVAARGVQQLIYKTSIVCIRPHAEIHILFGDTQRPRRRNVPRRTYPSASVVSVPLNYH
jgi:host factor-I protein